MKIQHFSELMQNQKQAAIMSTDSAFQVLESYDGHSFFFSVGTDDVLYLTRELSSEITGWSKIDLSSGLSAYHGGNPVKAKVFAVSQSPLNGAIDIALAITVDGADYLYVSIGNSYQDPAWTGNISWLIMPFKDPGHVVPVLVINDIYINQSGGNEFILVDILKDPGSSLDYIYRYAVDPSAKDGNYWIANNLSGNLAADGLVSCLGRKKGQLVDGTYTYGKNVGKEELLYTPLWNPFSKGTEPSATRLEAPTGTTAIASALNYGSVAPGNTPVYTDLYVAAGDSLHCFPWDAQSNDSKSQVLVSNPILSDVKSLYAHADEKVVIIWGLNGVGEIFYLECPAGQQTAPSAWTYPLAILYGVEQMAFFINSVTDNNVLFAYTHTAELLQLTQDPVTSTWIQRQILLPTTDVDDVLEVDTFTTQITVTDDDNLPASEAIVLIRGTSPVSVYINDVYSHIKTDAPIEVTTDYAGNISIMQETQAIGAICYQLELPDGTVADVNPMNKMLDIMGTIKSGADLASVEVTDANGNQQPLVPKDTPSDQLDATSIALQELVRAGGTMPPDGSNLPGVESKRYVSKGADTVSTGEHLWGISYDEKFEYRNGSLALTHYRNRYGTDDFLSLSIKCIAGDVFNWLKHAYQDVKGFFSDVVDGVTHFFIEIGGKIYSFILNSINVVVRSIEMVFNKIKVFLEDLIKWIGFLFQWKDILRTHSVLKSLFLKFADDSITNIDQLKSTLTKQFDLLEQRINDISGLPDIKRSISSFSSDAAPPEEGNSPQANWGINQTKNNAKRSDTSFDPNVDDPGELEKLLLVLVDTIGREEDIFAEAIDEIKTQIIDQLTSLPITDIIKRILGVLSKIVLSTVENVIESVLDILKIMVQTAVGVLDATIRIPVISKVYKKITNGSELSFLDLVCLVVAIPTTVVYKALNNKPPFDDTSFTTAVINAPDFHTLRLLYSGNGEVAAEQDAEQVMQQVLNLTASFASMPMLFFNICNFASLQGTEQIPKSVGFLGVANYMCYMAPNLLPLFTGQPFSPWYVDLNYAITAVSLLKALTDVLASKVKPWAKISPYVESAINATWCVPPIFTLIDASKGNPQKDNALAIPTSDILSNTGNFAFNLGGFITPLLTAKNPYISGGGLIGMQLCTSTYGILMTLTAASENKE
ncbi:hypothetical protein [Pedobacter miscanthi]|uniref:Uncharacterized protein n=1 Tax=Pedobacter miscanthi TaxID=2259170 RepID=A0A366LE04_9SPHI|nr:hypothetical protein [Pedobacter miscanthi]RBQ11723.1 hypothetical protein DRW42_00120 [Pedobacter miscanthi]